MKKLLLATGVSILSMAAVAGAVEYSAADANGDGQVTLMEAQAVLPEASVEMIAAADLNGDGILTSTEFEALAQ
ncbi:MAG: hypothetical protein MnENMB40S_09440 [Rhizobiaceae bacterium MnEN-MB40S]|nr:MAG: hypothetical protein MnENMB40S_09440 [Rhizobiaceae bacterium MnEN-MB40S]